MSEIITHRNHIYILPYLFHNVNTTKTKTPVKSPTKYVKITKKALNPQSKHNKKKQAQTKTKHTRFIRAVMFIKQLCTIILSRSMLMNVEVLKDIKEELKELRLLFKELAEKLIPVEEPTVEERKAIEEKDETANEKELMKALG
jgi:hypothetical protein